jgi:hypothetical protein
MTSYPVDFHAVRSGDRKRVLMRGTIFAPSGAHVILIRDISSKVALISAEDMLPEHCDVIFKRGPIFAAARIAWSKGKLARVEFYRDLPQEHLSSAAMPLPSRED